MWRVTMKFVHIAVAVLSLLSVGQSAPVSSCESLTQLIEINGTEQLLGKWTYIAEGTDIPASKMLTKMFVETGRVKITSVVNQTEAIELFQSQKMFGICFTVTSKMTLANSTLSSVQPFVSSAVLLSTGCPDCMVFHANYTTGQQTFRGLQLLSKRSKVTTAELEEFRKQAECLGLPSPAILEADKGSCPVDSSSQETEVIDLTEVISNIDSEIFSLFDGMSDDEGGMEALLKMVSGGLKAY